MPPAKAELALAGFLELVERAAALLRPEEATLAARKRVNGAWYDYLPLAAKEGAALLEAHGTLFAGLGFDAPELRRDPARLQALLSARAAVAELLDRLDRAVLFYKERIARRTSTLQRSLVHKLRDEGLPAATRAALRDSALPFLRLFETHNALREARRRSTLRLRQAAQAASPIERSREEAGRSDEGANAALVAIGRPALTERKDDHEAKEGDQDAGGGGLRHGGGGPDGAGADGGGA